MSEKTRVIGSTGGALGLGAFGAAIGACCGLPRLLMHQLGALRGSTEFPHLDSRVFAQQVQTLLAQLPTSTGTAALAHQARQ
jgi:hypothetical protein